MRGTHWEQGYNRPTGCCAERLHTPPFNFFFKDDDTGYACDTYGEGDELSRKELFERTKRRREDTSSTEGNLGEMRG